MDRFLLVVAMFAAPLVAGLLLGALQLVGYRLLRRSAPPFYILLGRGVLAAFVLAALAALGTRLLSP